MFLIFQMQVNLLMQEKMQIEVSMRQGQFLYTEGHFPLQL